MLNRCHSLMNIFEDISSFFGLYQNKKRSYNLDDEFTSTELKMLEIIIENRSITPTEISKKIYKTKSAVSQMIKKLIMKDLIYILKSEKDQRVVEFGVSQRGILVHNAHKAYEHELASVLKKKLENFEANEIETIEKFLNIYREFQFEVSNIKIND